MTGPQAVVKYLKTHKNGLSSLEAQNKLHIGRLAATINRLRNRGYEIDTYMYEGENEYGKYRYGRYFLVKEP